jgi:hypothetical protein
MNATREQKEYVRALKSPKQRDYARSYLLWLLQEGKDYVTKLPRPEPHVPFGLPAPRALEIREKLLGLGKCGPGFCAMCQSNNCTCLPVEGQTVELEGINAGLHDPETCMCPICRAIRS